MGIGNKTIGRRNALLTPQAGGGLDPTPFGDCTRESAFDTACKAVWGRVEWAIVLLVPARPAPDADASRVPEVVTLDNVPHDPQVAVTSLREGGAGEQRTAVAYELHRSIIVWGAEDTTTLDAIKPICRCSVHWRPHRVHQPNVVLSSELMASNGEIL